MIGKAIAIFIAVTAVVAGASMYYLQVYAYYEEVELAPDALTLLPEGGGPPQPIAIARPEAIDANSSPLRFRACFDTPLAIPEALATFEEAADAEPLTSPGWFDCFDVEAIGTALERGTARAFVSEKNIAYGVDRIVALTGDGRGYAWHQLNDCGELAYDGTPTGEACPPRDADTPEDT